MSKCEECYSDGYHKLSCSHSAQVLTVVAHCCQDWDMPIGMRWGHCGLCGEVPKVLDDN